MGKIWIEQGGPASRGIGTLHLQPFNVTVREDAGSELPAAPRGDAPVHASPFNVEHTRPTESFWNGGDPIEARIAERAGSLSNAERNVCVFIKKNASSKDIASQLGISKHTVDTHRKNIRRKLGLHEKESLYSVLVRI